MVLRKVFSVIISLILLFAIIMPLTVFASRETSSATAELIDYIDALYFDNPPAIDGYVSESEWGTASFTVEATDAATKDDSEQYNRFIYWRTGDLNDYSSWSYSVWLRWDDNYFYVAAKVNDPDIHSLKNGATNTWDGDAFQMRVDRLGPNAIIGGQEFTVNESYSVPWSSNSIPDFIFGYVQIAGGFSEAWENSSNKGMTSFSKNPLGIAKCVVAPAGYDYSVDTKNGITTYEVAIPWIYILNGESDKNGSQITSLTYTTFSSGRKGNLSGGIGREFGVSAVVLNDGTNPDPKWDSYLAWGSGICTAHQTDGARSATGSNSVVLSKEKVTQTAGYMTYNPTSLLDASFSQENIDPKGVFYDYLAGDLYKENKITYDELSSLTYDEDPDGDLSVFGLYALDFIPKDKVIIDIGGEHKTVFSALNNRGEAYGEIAVNHFQTGVEGEMYEFPTSYTFELENYYTDTIIGNPGYESALYYWFGGNDTRAFQCGYFFNDRQFKLVNTYNPDQVLATKNYNLKKDTWYRWRFQFDNESCTARLWIDDLSTDADNGDGWGELIFNSCCRYFYYPGVEMTLLSFRQMNVQAMYDNVKIYNFGSISDIDYVDETDGSIINGGGSGVATTTITGGGEVSIDESNVYKKDNQWHVPVPVKNEYLGATQLTFLFEYDATKAKFTGISGLADGTYTITETEAGTVAIVIKSFDEIKKMKAGDTCFEIILDATDTNATAKDLKLSLTDSYVYTVITGDTMIFVMIGCLSAIAIVTSAIIIRRKKARIG